MGKIAIVDYQLGNLFSVTQALKKIGLEPIITSDPKEIESCDAAVLPGMGAFKDAMSNLKSMDLEAPLRDFVKSSKPFLGVCLGLQLLFSESEEFGSSKGLDIISGTVPRFKNSYPDSAESLRVPQIGWNKIFPGQKGWDSTPFKQLEAGEFMYFVHSYYVLPEDESVTAAITHYGPVTYTSAIMKDNIFACQFHPEKSATKGLSIYREWALSNRLITDYSDIAIESQTT